MKIKWIEVENILSIGNAHLPIKDMGLTLIDGWNYDDDCANGAGKTAFPNSMSFGLYGKIPRKITASDVLRKGTKKGWTKVCVQKGNDEWIIKRGRPKLLEVTKNGDLIDITQEALELQLGLTYSQFLISMYSSQTESQKLINLNDTQTKDFFLQLMNLDKLTAAKKNADGYIKDFKCELEKIEREFISLKSSLETNSTYLVDEDSIKDKISKICPSPLLAHISTLEKVQKPDLTKHEEIEGKIRAKERDLDASIHERSVVARDLDRAQRDLIRLEGHTHSMANEVDCPHCSESFGLGPQGAYTMESLIKKNELEIQSAIEMIATLKDNLGKIPDESGQKGQINKIRTGIRDKKEAEYAEYASAQEQIMTLKVQLGSQKTSMSQLQSQLDNNEVIKKRMSDCKAKMKHHKGVHDHKTAEKKVYEEISQMFSPTGAAAYIMDSIVDTFNEKMADYIRMIWPRATYQITTSKENKDGEIKAKFSQDLIINGENLAIGSLSGGEHKCLSLCMDFTVIDILQSMFGSSLNPIIMDEPFDGLDSSNREKVLELLEKLAVDRNIIVIDHASESKSMFSDIIMVEKRNGISEIK